MKAWKVLVIILMVLFIVFVLLYKPIFRPSYFSVISVCDGLDILEEYNWSIMGQTTVTYNNSEIENITVILYTTDITVQKHEHIHVVQARQYRLFGCDNMILMYLTEIEAYTMQNLPDSIFRLIYGEF